MCVQYIILQVGEQEMKTGQEMYHTSIYLVDNQQKTQFHFFLLEYFLVPTSQSKKEIDHIHRKQTSL